MVYNTFDTKEILEESFKRLEDLYLTTSVLNVVRTYAPKNNIDMECWTFFCAMVNFQVPVINWLMPMLRGLMKEMEIGGKKFLDVMGNPESTNEILSTFRWKNEKRGFSHRFIRINDFLYLFEAMKSIVSDFSSFGELAKVLYEKGINDGIEEPVGFVIKRLASEIRNRCPELVEKNRFLVPNPSGNSAMKRMCLFIRWMVRPYPDLGIWNFIEPGHLLVPLDLGVMRSVRRALGIQLRKTPKWEDVIKITKIFKDINPEDPIKYDYVFSRPAIMGYCRKNPSENKCYLCPLNSLCKSRKPPPKTEGKPLASMTERKILNEFLDAYGHQFDKVSTEYPLGLKKADAVVHMKNCKWYVVEVEEKLSYTAIGQAFTYKWLYEETENIRPEAMIVCKRADLDLKDACEIDAGIRVIVIP